AQIGLLKEGDMVKANFPDIDKTIDTRITYVGQVVDKQTRTFNVEAALTSKEVNVKANMIAKLMINDETANNALVVPTNTVQTGDDGKPYVLVAEKGTAVKKNVEPGTSYDGRTLIKSGLKPGDKVISFGYSEVVDGQKISY
ncbi:MAG: efflux RND transporter periplasmic adaptor subunit, partial [Bacteroidetes bacterium]|nr:efflux RND transporter periplasmic adaptor subunit [Bacteroidota bacterium]